MKLYFATGNPGKVEEIRDRLDELESDVEVEQVEVNVEEIQELEVRKVAPRKAKDSYRKAVDQGLIEEGDPLIVEDTGFFVDSLGGFPGTFAKHFSVTVGAEKLVRLLDEDQDRSATFRSAIVYYDGETTEMFVGEMRGRVPENPRGDAHEHLPYNSIAIPEGESETLAENPVLKDGRHHRNQAVDSFCSWIA